MYWLTSLYHLVTKAESHAIIWKKIQSLTDQKKSFSRQAANDWRNSQAWEGGGYGQIFMVRHTEKYRPYKANSSEGWGQQPSEAFKVYVCGVWIVWYGYRQVFQGGESRHPGNVPWKERITESSWTLG